MRSKNFIITTPTATGAHVEDSLRSKIKVEGGSSVPKVKEAMAEIKVREEVAEIKVDELKEIKVRASSIQILFLPNLLRGPKVKIER
jgi:hypothetical protein